MNNSPNSDSESKPQGILHKSESSIKITNSPEPSTAGMADRYDSELRTGAADMNDTKQGGLDSGALG